MWLCVKITRILISQAGVPHLAGMNHESVLRRGEQAGAVWQVMASASAVSNLSRVHCGGRIQRLSMFSQNKCSHRFVIVQDKSNKTKDFSLDLTFVPACAISSNSTNSKEENMAKRKPKSEEIAADEAAAPTNEPVVESTGEPEAAETEPAGDGEKKQWLDKGPKGRHRIDLGDGRVLRLSRSERWQQMRIEFLAGREGVDPKPKAEDGDTQWLKDHGWRWRNEEKAWTKQLAKNTDENWAARGNSDQESHEQFVDLANRIRQRHGLEPVSGISSAERAA
jgi:hypothetical protein